MKKSYLILLSVVVLACQKPAGTTEPEETTTQVVIEYNNPPAEGFDLDGSNPIAILLADQVMNSMGGRKKWDETHVLYWNFFGARTLLWDKANNRVRVDYLKKDLSVALDMNTMTGKVWKNGSELPADSLSNYLSEAKSVWINDSYWLVMPFKLKDSGVRLSYLREDTTQTGEKADVLWLTFNQVGDTPENAYAVWVSNETRLVKQWAYYPTADDESPRFVLPWTDYQDFDGLKLSGNRGERSLTDIRVLKEVPEEAFSQKLWSLPL